MLPFSPADSYRRKRYFESIAPKSEESEAEVVTKEDTAITPSTSSALAIQQGGLGGVLGVTTIQDLKQIEEKAKKDFEEMAKKDPSLHTDAEKEQAAIERIAAVSLFSDKDLFKYSKTIRFNDFIQMFADKKITSGKTISDWLAENNDVTAFLSDPDTADISLYEIVRRARRTGKKNAAKDVNANFALILTELYLIIKKELPQEPQAQPEEPQAQPQGPLPNDVIRQLQEQRARNSAELEQIKKNLETAKTDSDKFKTLADQVAKLEKERADLQNQVEALKTSMAEEADAKKAAEEAKPAAAETRNASVGTNAEEAKPAAAETRNASVGTNAEEAKTVAEEAKIVAEEAKTAAKEAKTAAEEAKTAAEKAKSVDVGTNAGEAKQPEQEKTDEAKEVAKGIYLKNEESEILDAIGIKGDTLTRMANYMPEFFDSLPACSTDTSLYLNKKCETAYFVLWSTMFALEQESRRQKEENERQFRSVTDLGVAMTEEIIRSIDKAVPVIPDSDIIKLFTRIPLGGPGFTDIDSASVRRLFTLRV